MRYAIHLISTNIWSWLSSFALSFPSAGTGTAAFFQRSRTLVGLPVTIRSDSEHVMVAASAPVLRRIAAVAPPLIFLYQQLAVCAPPSDLSWLAIGTPSVGKGIVCQRTTCPNGWGRGLRDSRMPSGSWLMAVTSTLPRICSIRILLRLRKGEARRGWS